MKLFIDTANIDEIREANSMGLLDGVTTNPSLIAKTGRPFRQVIEAICQEVDGPVSAEAISPGHEEMLQEARSLATIHPNIVVKIPLTLDGLKTVRACRQEGIRTNVTLCFSPSQALLAAKAGASYISPFVGRLDDISEVGMELIEKIDQIYSNYDFATEILVASIRHPLHLVDAALIGADVATVPFDVLRKLVQHPLTDRGIELFNRDWAKVPQV
ncbi:MAG: fructose-6-phosphate aldolase [Myxococcota bacterium]|jgi:transaldolase|nr:fructose-6-phosphate aldolase [Myxococcota bacterium]